MVERERERSSHIVVSEITVFLITWVQAAFHSVPSETSLNINSLVKNSTLPQKTFAYRIILKRHYSFAKGRN